MNDDLPKTSRRITAPFQLGDLEILPASNEVRGRRGVERLRPLLMDILLRLAAQPGEVVRRETLLEDVWARRMVNDEVLSRAIAELRTALGDDARQARYIETIPKIGYRLVAQVGAGAPAARSPPAARPSRRPLAYAAGGALLAAAAALAWFLFPRAAPAPDAGIESQLARARAFASGPALELAPRFSPDGRSVAYVAGEGAQSQVVIQAIDGPGRRTIADKGWLLHSPSWFPDGKRIALWRAKDGDCAIVERHLETGAERKLVDCALAPRARFDLSPDGLHLVFTGKTRPQYPAGLWLASTDGGAPVSLTAPEPGNGDDATPRFSPDGKRIAFFRGDESHRKPWILERDAPANVRVAAAIEGLSYGVAWLGRDGPLLAAADWFGFRALNVLDPARRDARLAGARGARFPDVSVNGDVVFEMASYAANAWLVDARGATPPRELWRSTRYSNQPQFSPDGKRVAFASNREGFDAIYAAELGAEPLRIAAGEKYRYIRPHWSADGRFVYAVRILIGPAGKLEQHGVRIPSRGGVEEVLPIGDRVNAVAESADGASIYFAEIAGQSMRLMRAPAATASPVERLPLPLVTEYQLNGERLVFAQPQLDVLTSCRLPGLACEPLPVKVTEADLFHWKLGPRSLYLRARDEEKAWIARYDFAAGRVVDTVGFAPTGTGTSIAVSPDERHLLVIREEGPAIDLMIARRIQ